MAKNIALLTATITPPASASNLARVDPEARKADYKTALKFYLDLCKVGVLDKVIICDNSSTDLDFLRQIARTSATLEQLELISFFGLDYPSNYSRGYGEFKLLDYAMGHSETIKGTPDDTIIWKLTGRYIIRNLTKIITTKPPIADLYVHCRTIPQPWVEMFVMGWNKSSYHEIIGGMYHDFGEQTVSGLSAESIFFDRLAKNSYRSKIIRRFNTVPEIEGVRGWDGKRYEEMKGKIWLRRISNTLFPWLWI